MANSKIMFSGVKPTGRPHIGNYFGAMRQFVQLQDKYDSLVMIADYHALNFIQNADEMTENIVGVMMDYLAIGLDPKKVILFKQSDVPEHTELTWIFDTITTMPYLQRAHAYKDALAKNKEISAGTFNYPMLMATDILLYDPAVVPVGSDQKQHVEIARDTAEKFNRIFGETFKLPEPMILSEVQTVPGIDGQKMSKSYNNTIPLFASDEEIRKSVMSIVTDSGEGEPTNVKAIHLLVKPAAEVEKLYSESRGKYQSLKEALITDLTAFISPLREKRKEWESRREEVLKILKEGGEKARERAAAKMNIVRERIGVKLY
ncbi:MAG TPA: tryptophan--tRNA ligase [Candidatus Paceibacterota bacterium]|nr:tryptophan--tRNA ligase [Candidatus Paceibacterota bacterium]